MATQAADAHIHRKVGGRAVQSLAYYPGAVLGHFGAAAQCHHNLMQIQGMQIQGMQSPYICISHPRQTAVNSQK